MRLLVVDAYTRQGRVALRGAGGTEGGRLYERLLRELAPEASIDLAYPADPDFTLPAGVALSDYDGLAWTGSSLSILNAEDPAVLRQIGFARAGYEAGVPAFGSCWAAQLACVAAGGRCRANPKGREFGVSRRITLEPEGRAHPLYRDKPPVFDAFTSHADEIELLPRGATLLAHNAFSAVQSLDVRSARGSFWAVQYHPEYDPHEVAALSSLRADELVEQGSFADLAAVARFSEQLETLQREPSRHELARELRMDPTLLDAKLRTLEVRNWLEQCVRPRIASRM